MRPGIPEIARSIGFATCSVTSDAPAPGYGATTVTIGKEMSGRSSCLRLPQARIPATNRPAASSRVTLRLEMASWDRRVNGISWSVS